MNFLSNRHRVLYSALRRACGLPVSTHVPAYSRDTSVFTRDTAMRSGPRRPSPEFLEFRSLLSLVGSVATNVDASPPPTAMAPAVATSGPTADPTESPTQSQSGAEEDAVPRTGLESDSPSYTMEQRDATTGSESDSGDHSGTNGQDDAETETGSASSSSPTGQTRASNDDGSERDGGGSTSSRTASSDSGGDDGGADSEDGSQVIPAPPPTSTPPSSGSTGTTDDGSADDGKSVSPVGGTGTQPMGPFSESSTSTTTAPSLSPTSTPVAAQIASQGGRGSSGGEAGSATSPGSETNGVKQTSRSTTSGTDVPSALSGEEAHTGSGAAAPIGIGVVTSGDARGAATPADDSDAAPSSGISARASAPRPGTSVSPVAWLPAAPLPPSASDGPRASGDASAETGAGAPSPRPVVAEGSAQTETLQSRAADLIASCSPFDPRAVEQAIDQLLAQLNDFDVALSQSVSNSALIPSLVATVIVLTASEMVRRRLSRPWSNAGHSDARVIFPGLPGRSQRWALEEL